LKSPGRKALIVVLDGVGIGALPDAALYGDEGSNTLGNLATAVGGLDLPNLQRFGLGNIAEIKGIAPAASPLANYGRMAEASPGKDSTSGHWEMAGLVLERPFPTYPRGFPPEVMRAFEKAIGRGTLGNVAASGTEIIKRLGDEHVRTGKPIVYTSADSVFQIAAHEEVIGLEELYRICGIARGLLTGPHAVGRVIARPFLGPSGGYYRTPHRTDFSICPPRETLVDLLSARGLVTKSIGKVDYLFAKRGFTDGVHAASNAEVIEQLVTDAAAPVAGGAGLVFANLVDFDMLWGHRNDVEGFRRGLEEFDRGLPRILDGLGPDNLLAITADHGNDPTTPSTDHSREHVPLLVYGKTLRQGVDLGLRKTFADLGATIGEMFGVRTETGTSFLSEISRG
jgi:phosphopentomutase